jgi:parallel beta-helix repeat protein
MKLKQILLMICVMSFLLVACSSTDKKVYVPKVLEVKSGESIQTVVNKAKEGDLVLVEPGTYGGSIVIQTKDITLRGKDRNTVIIEGRFEQDNGIIVAADGVRIENLTVQKFRSNGVLVQGGYDSANSPGANGSGAITTSGTSTLKRYSVQYVNALANGLYGIYAFSAQEGVIANTFTYANADAGIYIGQCKPCNADVNDNYAQFNGLGLQGANASDALYVYQNIFENNRTGIHFLSETQEKKAPQEKVIISANLIHNNNNEDAPTTTPDIFGYGIVVAGGGANSILSNTVSNHSVGGIVLTNQGDYLPSNNKVVGNLLIEDAIDLQYFISGRPDVMSLGNCFEKNTFGSSNIEGIESKLLCEGAEPGPFTASYRPKGKTKEPPIYSEVALPVVNEIQMPGDLKEIPKKIKKILVPDLSLVKVPDPR